MVHRCIAQVALERNGAIPEDFVVNTWHFEADDAQVGETFTTKANGLATRLDDFYSALSTEFGGSLTGNGFIKIYDWSDPMPRVPAVEQTMLFGKGSTALPGEVAICLSMAAEVSSGQEKARRRGRVYIGPLSNAVIQVVGSGPDVRVAAASRTAILDAAEDLAHGSNGSFRLAVYSPTTKAQGGSDDEAWNDVKTLWVDDAFDIQRRRGSRATLKDLRTLTG